MSEIRNDTTGTITSFPVGNGRLGALAHGTPGHEILDLFEESLWSGACYDRINPDSLNGIKEVSTLISQERYAEAQEQSFECLTATPSMPAAYVSSGRIHINFYDPEHRGTTEKNCSIRNNFLNADSFKRELDFETGITTASFSVEGSVSGQKDFSRSSSDSSITYTRECFASGSGNVIVYHISSSVPKSIFFRASIEKEGCAKKYSLTNDTIACLDTNGVPSCIMMTAVTSGGTVSVKGENLVVEKSDYVTLYIDVETGYRRSHFRRKMGDVHKKPLSEALKCADLALKRICFASGTSYENLRADYISEFTMLNSSAVLYTDGTRNRNWDECKYRLICNMRSQATLPKVKKGLWNLPNQKDDSGYFNLRDNSIYPYSTGMTGLAFYNEPFHRLAKRIYKNGKKVAEKMYGSEGFVCHNMTNIWGDAAPCGTDLASSYSPLGALTIARALVTDYEYTLDSKQLNKNLKILKAASTFFLQNLKSANEKKELILSPSFTEGCKKSSGALVYISEKSEKDSSAIKEIFSLTLRAMEYLGKPRSDSFAVELSEACKKLAGEYQETLREIKPEDFDIQLFKTGSSIIDCRMDENRMKIELLKDSSSVGKEGRLENLHLMGNIIADIEWSEGNLTKAFLHSEPGKIFWKDITVIYKNREYKARISDEGTLDIKNILPSTI